MSDWWDYGSQGNAEANACAANQGAQMERLACKVCGSTVHDHIGTLCVNAAVDGREMLAKRIAELEAENAKLREQAKNKADAYAGAEGDWLEQVDAERRRANALADECGRLRDENTQLLAENARLRRGKR